MLPFSVDEALMASPHEFHFSKGLIEFAEEEEALQITLHVFIDDLEEALRRQGADKLYICTDRESPEAEKHMEAYFRRHFRLTVNGQPVAYEFLGKEVSEDLSAVWCYLEVLDVEGIERLGITNDILLEVFDDQKNVMTIIGPGKKKGFMMFEKGKDSEEVFF